MTQGRLAHLVELMATLRGPNGCPWDREQTHASLKEALLEETWEVIAEIEQDCADGLQEELGDLLLHVVFHAQIASENDQFNIDDVIDGVAQKLVRRHPHIFGDETALSPKDVEQTWERVKQQEKQGKSKPAIPPSLPALVAARKLQSKLESLNGTTFEPINIEQTQSTLSENDLDEAAIGQLLFSVVALARQHKVDPETALSKTLLHYLHDD